MPDRGAAGPGHQLEQDCDAGCKYRGFLQWCCRDDANPSTRSYASINRHENAIRQHLKVLGNIGDGCDSIGHMASPMMRVLTSVVLQWMHSDEHNVGSW